MRVSLITTGVMEFRGLANALRRLFPAHVFDAEPNTPGKPFNGFTDTGAACQTTTQSPRRPRPFWLIPARSEHPKAYMKWLLRDPALAMCSKYMESQEGVRILERLDWTAVLAQPTWFPYLRALVRDLESALGPPAFDIAPGGNEAPWTSISQPRVYPMLRNI